jgi:transposase-like protein
MTFATEEAGQIMSQDAQGRVLVSRERRESLLKEYDRSGMTGVKVAQYVGIKYSTLAYWLQSRRRCRQREKLLMKAGEDTEPGKSNGGGLKRSLRTVHRLAYRQERYGFTLQGAPTVR